MPRKLVTLACTVTLLATLVSTNAALSRVNNLEPLPADEQDLLLLSAIQRKDPEGMRALLRALAG